MRMPSVIGALLLFGGLPPVAAQASEHDSPACSSDVADIDREFEGAAFASCEVSADGHFRLTITREDANVTNPSPWYAFRVTPRVPGEVIVTLTYEDAGHRYWPKVSEDGEVWTRMAENAVVIEGDGGEAVATLSLQLGNASLLVAAQELLLPADYSEWLKGHDARPFAILGSLGASAEGRDISLLRIANPLAEPGETAVLVGRQHPPEVTGGLAMMAFVDAVMGDSALAEAFRARFETLVIPLLNPDGVVRGHWRHNTGEVDLNRDWGPFTQPETALMRDLLAEVDADPARKLRVLIDFHSTGRDVFYTIPDELPTEPELFTRNWLSLYQQRMPGYEVNRDARHEAGRPISKAYVYDTYRIPGITFEIGDETPRDLIRDIGRESAYAMMVALLEVPPLVSLPVFAEVED